MSLEVPQDQLEGCIISGKYSQPVCIDEGGENIHPYTLNLSGCHHRYTKQFFDGEEIYVISQTTSLDEGRHTFADIPMSEPTERDGNVAPDCDLSRYTVLCEPISPEPIETTIDEMLSLAEKDTFSDLMWNDLPEMSVDAIYQELSNITPYYENGHVQETMDY